MKPDLVKAWILLTCSLTIHVIDEAYHDFLSIWNSIANISGFLPEFSFTFWLTMLIIGILILFGLIPIVHRGVRWICYLSLLYGFIMILNGFGHIAISIYFQEPAAGTYSSPLLLVFSIYLIWSAFHILRINRLKKSNLPNDVGGSSN